MKAHILYSIKFFDSRAVYGIIWNNIIQSDRSQMTTRRMRIACWIPKATNIHSESLINISRNLIQGSH